MGLISKRVKVLDCRCDYKEKRGVDKEWDGFEFCSCTTRVKKGTSIVDAPGTYRISSIYIKSEQNRG